MIKIKINSWLLILKTDIIINSSQPLKLQVSTCRVNRAHLINSSEKEKKKFSMRNLSTHDLFLNGTLYWKVRRVFLNTWNSSCNLIGSCPCVYDTMTRGMLGMCHTTQAPGWIEPYMDSLWQLSYFYISFTVKFGIF